MCFCVYFYCELWNPCFQRIWSRICSSSTSYFLSTWGASWFVAMNNHRIFFLPVFVFLRCVDGLRKWYFNYVAYVGLCSLFVPSLVWVLISTSVGISYCLLELFLCGSECVSHEPNLKGKCKMKCIHKDWIHYIQLPAKLLDYFLRNNKSNINQNETIGATLKWGVSLPCPVGVLGGIVDQGSKYRSSGPQIQCWLEASPPQTRPPIYKDILSCSQYPAREMLCTWL